MKMRSESRLSDCHYRHQWISEAAYFMAEKRSFQPGMALEDWLLAEHQFVAMLIKRYLNQAHEDGNLSVPGLQRLAKSVGVDNSETLTKVDELVHAIQVATDNAPCFNFEPSAHCTTSECCLWKAECKQMVASWHPLKVR